MEIKPNIKNLILLSTAISGEDIWEDLGEDDVIWFLSNFLCSMGLSEV